LDQLPPFPPYMGRKELSPPFHSFPNFDGMVGAPPHVSFPPHDDHPPFMHNIHRPGMPPHIAERKPWGPQVANCLLSFICSVWASLKLDCCSLAIWWFPSRLPFYHFWHYKEELEILILNYEKNNHQL
jgi:hypothetical protein